MQQFKVGDWVNTTSWQYENKPAQITTVEDDKYYIENRKGIGGWTFPASKLVPWQPKEGEWCWFWDDTSLLYNGTPHFGRYGSSSYTLDFYQHCEPFVGELPSFLQEIL